MANEERKKFLKSIEADTANTFLGLKVAGELEAKPAGKEKNVVLVDVPAEEKVGGEANPGDVFFAAKAESAIRDRE